MASTEGADGLMPQTSKQKPNVLTISPREFILKYLRFLPLVLICIVLMLVLAYIKIRYTTNIYKVQSSLLIKNENNPSSKDQSFDELFMASGNAMNLNNEMEILRSNPVMQRVAGDLHLQMQYVNRGKVRSSLLYPESPVKLDLLHIRDSSRPFGCAIRIIGGNKFLLNDGKTPHEFGQVIAEGDNSYRVLRDSSVDLRAYPNPDFLLSYVPVDFVGASLAGGLRITQTNDQSTILTLIYEGENSNLGRDILNTLMAVYDTLIVEDKNRIARNTLQFINDRLLELSDTLRGVQGGLRDFMVGNQLYNIEGQSKADQEKIDESGKARFDLEVKMGVVDFMLKYVSDKNTEHNLVPTDLAINEPVLLQMISQYNSLQLQRDNNLKTTTENNPLIIGMDDALAKLRRNIYQALLNVKQAYLITADNLEKRSRALQGHITSLPGKSMQFLNKERQQRILEGLYSLLLQKQLEIRLSSASTISNSRALEPAIGSSAPISPDRKKIYTLYFLIGLLVPVGFIAIREFLQDKVSGRSDVEKYCSAPILGEIGHSASEQPLVVTSNSRSLIAEQFRIIRTNLKYVVGKKERPVIMVTSSFSGEGKSFVSTNMGAVMALSGKRTVIMEFDIRKPKIISGLELKRKMGITNYIIGKASFDELLVKVDGFDNLYVMPCGPIPPNPAEILLDERLAELMKEVHENFEVVIMDTAPVGLVSDAINLARYADCVLYIVRQKQTLRKQLSWIEELYESKKLPGLCLLVNDIKPEAGYYGIYYGTGYGYYSGYGYGERSGYFEGEDSTRKKGVFKKLNWLKRKLFG